MYTMCILLIVYTEYVSIYSKKVKHQYNNMKYFQKNFVKFPFELGKLRISLTFKIYLVKYYDSFDNLYSDLLSSTHINLYL